LRGEKRSFAKACEYYQDIRTDFVEKQDVFELYAEVPGVSKQELQVDVDGQVVRIGQVASEGTRVDTASVPSHAQPPEKSTTSPTGPGRRRRFRVRTLKLPDNADTSNTSAKCEAGVLTLTFPKKPDSQPRRVAVA
jgi:HSP20 family protein